MTTTNPYFPFYQNLKEMTENMMQRTGKRTTLWRTEKGERRGDLCFLFVFILEDRSASDSYCRWRETVRVTFGVESRMCWWQKCRWLNKGLNTNSRTRSFSLFHIVRKISTGCHKRLSSGCNHKDMIYLGRDWALWEGFIRKKSHPSCGIEEWFSL